MSWKSSKSLQEYVRVWIAKLAKDSGAFTSSRAKFFLQEQVLGHMSRFWTKRCLEKDVKL